MLTLVLVNYILQGTLTYYCNDPQITWLMVNWLALDASNYVRSVQSEVRRIFPVFGESSTICMWWNLKQHQNTCAPSFIVLYSGVHKYVIQRTSQLTPPPRPLHRCITVGLRDSALHESLVPTLRTCTLYVVTVRWTMLLHDWNCTQLTAVILRVPEMTENCEFDKTVFPVTSNFT